MDGQAVHGSHGDGLVRQKETQCAWPRQLSLCLSCWFDNPQTESDLMLSVLVPTVVYRVVVGGAAGSVSRVTATEVTDVEGLVASISDV